jgi:hypothetical protein
MHRVVANYRNNYVTHWHLERKRWLLGWSNIYEIYYDIDKAKRACDDYNTPPEPTNYSSKVVYPYDETPAGKAHR